MKVPEPKWSPRGAAIAFVLAGVWTTVVFGEPTWLVPPFATWDVAVVAVLAGIPLAVLLSAWIGRLDPTPANLLGRVIGAAAFVVSAVLVSLAVVPRTWSADVHSVCWGPLFGPATGVGVALSVVLMASPGRAVSVSLIRPEYRYMAIVVALLAAFALPSAYVESRCEQLQVRIGESLDQYRLVRVLSLSRELYVLSPAADVRGRPVVQLIGDVQPTVDRLRVASDVPLPTDAPAESRLERARTLAILDRGREAERVLEPLVDSRPPVPPAMELLGLVAEGEHRWRDGLEWYSRADDSWRSSVQAPGPDARRLTALKGIGFCSRKLGHSRGAETAYRTMMEIAESLGNAALVSESHLLLARFYEDAGLPASAVRHAEAAVLRGAQNTRDDARTLLSNLRMGRAGCSLAFPYTGAAGVD